MVYPLCEAASLFSVFNSIWIQQEAEPYINWKKYSLNEMLVQQPKFLPSFNEAIIRLIKHKFLPLQRSKASLHSRHSPQASSSQIQSHHISPQASLPSLPSVAHHLFSSKPDDESILLDKARQYIDCHRKGKSGHCGKVELKQYIALFQKPVQLNERGKRGSIEFNLMELDSRQKLEPLAAVSTDHEELELNQEERSIMNAKIRRKLNHRKIIDLAKRF